MPNGNPPPQINVHDPDSLARAWQYLLDHAAHMDKCIDEMKTKLGALFIWQKALQNTSAHEQSMAEGAAQERKRWAWMGTLAKDMLKAGAGASAMLAMVLARKLL